MRHLFSAVVAVLVALAASANNAFETEYRALMDSLDIVGVSVAVVKDNNIVYTHSFGHKDREADIALTDDALFRIASISKSFTVTAVMQLAEQGLVDIDADINAYLPFVLRNPRYPDTHITIKMLMSHTGSLNDSQDYTVSFDAINPAVSGADVAKCYNDYAPGQGYEYCNYDTNILACLIEYVTGQRWDRYVVDHVVRPLGIEGAGYCIDDLDSSRFATLYSWNDSVYVPRPEAYKRPDVLDNYQLCINSARLSAAGGMKITARDLAHYMLMHMNYGKSPLSPQRIISEASSRLMQTVVTDGLPKPPGDTDNAGLGLMRSSEFTPGYELVGHTGGAYGLRSAMFFDPEQKYGLVMICNGTTTRDILRLTLSLMHKHFIAQ